jgi:hypothetical protein
LDGSLQDFGGEQLFLDWDLQDLTGDLQDF